MTKTSTTGADQLANAVNNIPNYQLEAAEIEQWLKKRGLHSPNEKVMKALHDFITDGEPFSCALQYTIFINSLRGLLLIPEVRGWFQDFSRKTDFGISDAFNRLEKFFADLQDASAEAEIIRFGLLSKPQQYNNPDYDGIEGVLKPYRKD
jgi:hypothetical protein